MIIPEKKETKPPHARTLVDQKLSAEFLKNVLRKSCPALDVDDFANSYAKAFTRYEIAIFNKPKVGKTERNRAWKKIENASYRLLDTIDKLPQELSDEFEYALFQQEFLRKAVRSTDKCGELRTPPQRAYDLIQELSEVLRAAQLAGAASKTQTKSAYPLDTPLSNLLHDCSDLWSFHSSEVGVYYNSASEGYAGPFYEFIVTLFKEYFDPSIYQSEQALGKRLLRISNARQGKDIG